jgi:hypothetical protein
MPPLPWKSFGEIDPAHEYLVLAPYLPLRSYWRIPQFFRLTVAIQKQLASSPGLAGYSLLAQPLSKHFYTLSAWRGQEDLDAFVRALPHADVMRRLRPHMGRTRFATWTVPGTALPIRWHDAKARLQLVAGETVPA